VSEEDRRTVCIALTDGGRQLVDQVMHRRRQLVGELLAHIDPALHPALAEVMQAVMDAAGELSSDAWTLGWSVSDS
jgi:DNA-binding MarR family transcriptional regulator